MLMKDPKKSVSVIMARLNNKSQEMESEPKQDDSEKDDSVALHTAAEELMSAMEQKSPQAIASAFKSMMDLCRDEEYSEPQSEQSEE